MAKSQKPRKKRDHKPTGNSKVTGEMKGKARVFKKPKEHDSNWPFLVDEVVVTRPYRDCVAVSLTNNEGQEVMLSLNGWAKMQLKLENVHDAGYGLKGVSISKYIQAGLALEPLTPEGDMSRIRRTYKEARERNLIRLSNEL